MITRNTRWTICMLVCQMGVLSSGLQNQLIRSMGILGMQKLLAWNLKNQIIIRFLLTIPSYSYFHFSIGSYLLHEIYHIKLTRVHSHWWHRLYDKTLATSSQRQDNPNPGGPHRNNPLHRARRKHRQRHRMRWHPYLWVNRQDHSDLKAGKRNGAVIPPVVYIPPRDIRNFVEEAPWEVGVCVCVELY